MRRLPLLLLPLLVALSLLEGCQTAGVQGSTPPTALQTFDALYANAVTAEDIIVKTATTALASGLISAQQGSRVLAITDAVKTTLDAAYAAAQVGNTGLATANLAGALGPIAILSACLTTKPLTASTFNSCAAKLTLPVVQP